MTKSYEMNKYWIVVDNAHQGPYTAEELSEMQLTSDTYAWKPGMSKWTKISDIPDLSSLFHENNEAIENNNTDEIESYENIESHITAQQPPQAPPPPPIPPASLPYHTVNHITSHGDHFESNISKQENCPPNYMAWSIITTIVFFLPLGIVALIYSSKVNGTWLSGNREKARKYSEYAAWFSNIAFVAGLIWFPFSMAISMLFI